MHKSGIMDPVGILKPVPLKRMTRIGSRSDGGYVVYDRLFSETDILLTYGVGWDTSFEEHFHQITGKGALMFDPTMFRGRFLLNVSLLSHLVIRFKLREASSYVARALRWWWKRKKFSSQELYFIREGVADKRKTHFDTLQNHIVRYGLKERNILLKMDIEGDEYAVFENDHILSTLKNIHQIVIEWHHLSNRLSRLKAVLSRLKHDFEIVHVHGNNYGPSFKVCYFCHNDMKEISLPDVLEMTLVRRVKICPADRVMEDEKYPVTGLDQPNNPRKPDIRLDFIYKINPP